MGNVEVGLRRPPGIGPGQSALTTLATRKQRLRAFCGMVVLPGILTATSTLSTRTSLTFWRPSCAVCQLLTPTLLPTHLPVGWGSLSGSHSALGSEMLTLCSLKVNR